MVLAYIPRHHLPACARVSKAWYGATIPVLWKLVNGGELPKAIHRYAHFVKFFTLNHDPTERHLSLRFPNLVSLTFGSTSHPDIVQLITPHTSITHLEFQGLVPLPPWDALLGFRNLRHFKAIELIVSHDDIDKFWILCSKLEQLDIHDIPCQGSLSNWTFRRLKELRILASTSDDIPLVLEFMRWRPKPTSLDWCGKNAVSFTTEFIQLLNARTWPLLHSFDSRDHTMTSNDVLGIAQGMQQIVSFGFSVYKLQPELFLVALRPHFNSRKKLAVDIFVEMPDRFIPEILSSCPMLEIMEAPTVNAKDIVEGKPWVCLNLRELRMG